MRINLGINLVRRALLRTGMAAGAATLLPAARAHEYFTTHFTLIHPWTRASAPGATTAMICMTFDEVLEDDRLIGADTPLAGGAETGGGSAGKVLDIDIPKGIKTELTETGVHLRLVRLKQPLELAREYPIMLAFAKAGRLRASFLVDFPAAQVGASAPRGAMRGGALQPQDIHSDYIHGFRTSADVTRRG